MGVSIPSALLKKTTKMGPRNLLISYSESIFSISSINVEDVTTLPYHYQIISIGLQFTAEKNKTILSFIFPTCKREHTLFPYVIIQELEIFLIQLIEDKINNILNDKNIFAKKFILTNNS